MLQHTNYVILCSMKSSPNNNKPAMDSWSEKIAGKSLAHASFLERIPSHRWLCLLEYCHGSVFESLHALVVASGLRQTQCFEMHAPIKGAKAFSVTKKRADHVTAASRG